MAHQFKYASPEAKSEDLRRYDKQQEEFKKQKKMWGKFLLDFFLYIGEEKNIRFLVPFNEIIQIYEYLVETKKGFWKSFTSRQAEGLEGDAFAEVGLKPRRAFIIPIYDYAHIDKPYEGEDKRTPEEKFKRVKIFKRGIEDYRRLIATDEKLGLLKRDVTVRRIDDKTYNYIPLDPSNFLGNNTEEKAMVDKVLKEKIWLEQYAPKEYEVELEEIRTNLIIRPMSNKKSSIVVPEYKQSDYNPQDDTVPF